MSGVEVTSAANDADNLPHLNIPASQVHTGWIPLMFGLLPACIRNGLRFNDFDKDLIGCHDVKALMSDWTPGDWINDL